MVFAFTLKKIIMVCFEGLAQFKWNKLGEQDVLGQESFGAVFVIKYRTLRKDSDSRRVESVVEKLLGSSVNFIDVFTKVPIVKVPPF